MRFAVRFGALLMLILATQRHACATDYCPEGYYGYINGYFMYYCNYCDANGACAHAGVTASSMYTCGGDVNCCTPGATCIDPIPEAALKLTSNNSGKPVVAKTASSSKAAAPAPKPAVEPKKPAPAAPAAKPPRIPMLIGEIQQKKYLAADEKFIVPGDHVTVYLDGIVKVREPDNTDSYFRLFQVSYSGKDPKSQGTVYFGMEMDPEKPPMNAGAATRKKKGQGNVYKHTVRFNNENYDVSSVRVLPDTP